MEGISTENNYQFNKGMSDMSYNTILLNELRKRKKYNS